ncbi:MAG: IPT/TIG domain-containing protein [Actinobacteria bacterium]|nr:IPT/TIG domain-containing protein [Actinomycetota bacterium]MBU1942174.1 IPT/TIG domain-containing protein [Actinomycetota bacterium]MBU2686258.1 IPT/TIG domain-containing protein [Actinomycetota bacterium]
MKRDHLPVCMTAIALLVVLVLFLAAGPVLAGVKWTANGVLLRGFSFLHPQKPVIAPMSDGGAIIAWECSGDGNLYATRLDADGNEVWYSYVWAIVGFTAINPQIAVLADDSVVMTWQENRSGNWDVYAQRMLADGTWVWPENGVEVRRLAGSDAINPQIVGGIWGPTITWQDYRNGQSDLYAQKLALDGSAQWTANGVQFRMLAGSDATDAKIVTDDQDGAIIAWADSRNPGQGVYTQWVDSAGTPRWTANGVAVCAMAGVTAESARIGPDGEGGAIITWQDDRNVSTGGNVDIYAQKIYFTGAAAWAANGAPVRVLAGSDSGSPMIATGDTSRAVVTWQDERNGVKDIYAQRLDGDGGAPLWDLNGVAVRVVAGSNALAPLIATDGQGGAVVSWQDERNGQKDIYAQRIGTDGGPLWTPTEGVPVRVFGGSDTDAPYMVSDGQGGAVIAWQDMREAAVRLYAQRVGNDAPSVTGVDPDHGYSDGTTSVTITGDWLYPGAGVWLSMNGQPDIEATDVNVTSRNQLTCDIYPDYAPPGAWKLHVTNTDGQASPEDVDFEIEFAPPLVNGINPSVGNQGETHLLVVDGAHFRDVSTTIELRKGAETIEATGVIFKNANVMWANIAIPNDATLGSWDCYVRQNDDMKDYTLPGAFTMRRPQIDTIAPSQGYAGTTYHVSIAGSNTNWTMTPLEVDAGEGITVGNVAAQDDSHVSADFTVSAYPTPGPRDVTVTAGSVPQQVALADAFTVVPSSIVGCEPTSVVQGHTVNVDITGSHTHFQNGTSYATFSGTGITVNSTDVTDAGHATANITVAADAPTGTRDVNVFTGGEVPAPLRGVFTVEGAPPSPPHIDSLDPASGTVGTHVTVSGGHFGGTQGQAYVTFNGTKANSYTSWADGTVVCQVPTGATTGPVTVTTPAGASNGVQFTVTEPLEPLIKDCEPRVVYQGHSVELSVLGENTHFVNGKSVMVVSGKDGIKVGSTSASDATHASATLTVAADAAPGTRDVDVVTGSEHPEPLSNVLTVQQKPDNPPVITGVHPESGPVGTLVSITGRNFGEARGSSTVTFKGTPVTNYVSWSDHEVVCSVPIGAATGEVKVQTPWGTSDGTGFTVTDPTFYFAEGTTRPGFQPYLTIQNPNSVEADVKITYMKGDGTTSEQALTVPAHSRSTVTVTDVLGVGDDPAHDFSAKVDSTKGAQIIAERPMYFSYGAPQGLAWTGGSDVVGALSPAPAFYFAEGTTRPGFQPYLTIQNPNSVKADVKITYMKGDGTTQEQALTVPATTRSTVTVTDTLGVGDDSAHDFSCRVTSTNNVDIIAERPMYFSYGAPQGLAWTGGSDVVGALSPAEEFYFAEGTCRPGFQPYLTIQNPASTEANVVITYMKGDGTTSEQALTVPAHSRSTVTVTDVLGVGDDPAHDFSCKVTSTNNADIIAERPMYFDYQGTWTGGSDVVGALSPSPAFYFAEGTCRPGFSPYITIQNPGLAHASVKITYMKGDGTTQEQEVTVGAQSRCTVFVPDTLGVGNDAAHDFSFKVESTNGKSIIAERPMYFDYNGVWTGGSDVVGFSP